MATSYANTGGTGDRTSIITVTSNRLFETGAYQALVNGVTSVETLQYWVNGTLSADVHYVQFDFGSSKIIDEAKYYQQLTSTQGTWKWQGSADASSWSNIGSSFGLGGVTTQTITALSGNVTGYRYYRLLAVSGTSNDSPWIYEFEFKIDDAAGSIVPIVMDHFRQRRA